MTPRRFNSTKALNATNDLLLNILDDNVKIFKGTLQLHLHNSKSKQCSKPSDRYARLHLKGTRVVTSSPVRDKFTQSKEELVSRYFTICRHNRSCSYLASYHHYPFCHLIFGHILSPLSIATAGQL